MLALALRCAAWIADTIINHRTNDIFQIHHEAISKSLMGNVNQRQGSRIIALLWGGSSVLT